MKRKAIDMLLVMVVVFNLFGIYAQDSTITKTKSLSYTYHDCIITSWNVGKITGAYKYSYNNKTKKLVNQKAITHSTQNALWYFNKEDSNDFNNM